MQCPNTPEATAPAKVEAKPEVPVKVEAPAAEPAEEVNVPDTHIRIEAEKCLFCGKCEHNCPANAISIDRRNRTWTIDREKCITCGVCADGCFFHGPATAEIYAVALHDALPVAFQGRVLRRPARLAPAKEAPKDGEPHA